MGVGGAVTRVHDVGEKWCSFLRVLLLCVRMDAWRVARDLVVQEMVGGDALPRGAGIYSAEVFTTTRRPCRSVVLQYCIALPYISPACSFFELVKRENRDF